MLDDIDSIFHFNVSCLLSVMLTVLDSLSADNKRVTLISTCSSKLQSELVRQSYRFGTALNFASISVDCRERLFLKAFLYGELKMTYDSHSQTPVLPHQWREMIQQSIKKMASKSQGMSVGEVDDVLNEIFCRFKSQFLPVRSLIKAFFYYKNDVVSTPNNMWPLSKHVLFGISGIKKRLLSSLFAPYKHLEFLQPNNFGVKTKTDCSRGTGRPCTGLSILLAVNFFGYF